MEVVLAFVAVMMALAIPLVAILMPVMLVLGIVWICRGGRYRTDRARHMQETQLMQQIHQGLTALEARVEALETILLDSKAQPGATAYSEREV